MTKNRQQGIGLIEVLVTAFILAVGLLGLAALQTRSLQYNHGAYLRSQATILAYDISDRMRINRMVARAGSYNIAYKVNPPNGGSTLVAKDLYEWKRLLAQILPSGDGAIMCNSTSCSISVSWIERSGSDAVLAQGQVANEVPVEFVYNTRL